MPWRGEDRQGLLFSILAAISHQSGYGPASATSGLYVEAQRPSLWVELAGRLVPVNGFLEGTLKLSRRQFLHLTGGPVFPSNRSAKIHITSAQLCHARTSTKALPTNPPTTSIAENATSMAQSDNYLVGPNESVRINPAASKEAQSKPVPKTEEQSCWHPGLSRNIGIAEPSCDLFNSEPRIPPQSTRPCPGKKDQRRASC
jgi:hypothetical protein